MDFIDKIIDQKYGNTTYGDIYWVGNDKSGGGNKCLVDYEKNSSVVAIRILLIQISVPDSAIADFLIQDARTTSQLLNFTEATNLHEIWDFPYMIHGDKFHFSCDSASVTWSVCYQPIYLNPKTK